MIRSSVKINSTIGFLDHENMDLDTAVIILSAFVYKMYSNMCPTKI